MYLSFSYPQYLFLLFIIPLIILFHFWALKSARKNALKFANFEAIKRIKGIDLFSKNIIVLILTSLIIFILVLTISGMRLHTSANASSFSFVLAIDTSRSMQADDMKPDRLEAAKESAMDFVDSTPIATRIGVISFSGNSFISQDMTDSKNEIKNSIGNMEISDIEGTDVQEAVITGTNMLKNEDAKAIILLSDGQANVGRINNSIDYANSNDVIIHTIVIGTIEGGNISGWTSKVEEASLKAIAYNTGGMFAMAADKESLLNSLKQIMELTNKKITIDLSSYLLIALMILFILEYILVSTRYRAFP